MLVRTVLIESVGRHERLFSKFKPAIVAQFTERVAIVRGRLDPKASTATGYAWIIWNEATERFGNMQNPVYPQGRAVMFVAGPNGKGKQTVMQLVTDVRFDAVDASDLT